MKPTEILRREHAIIKRVLAALAAEADQIEAKGAVDAEGLRKGVTFLRSFADRCHHGKEEVRLFPLLQAKGVGCGPGDIHVLLAEHEQGRRLVRAMENSIGEAEKGEAAARAGLCGYIREYRHLLTEHIRKEDDCLFPAADEALSQSEQDELLRSFEEFDRKEIGESLYQQLEALGGELIVRWMGVEAEHVHVQHTH